MLCLDLLHRPHIPQVAGIDLPTLDLLNQLRIGSFRLILSVISNAYAVANGGLAVNRDSCVLRDQTHWIRTEAFWRRPDNGEKPVSDLITSFPSVAKPMRWRRARRPGGKYIAWSELGADYTAAGLWVVSPAIFRRVSDRPPFIAIQAPNLARNRIHLRPPPGRAADTSSRLPFGDHIHEAARFVSVCTGDFQASGCNASLMQASVCRGWVQRFRLLISKSGPECSRRPWERFTLNTASICAVSAHARVVVVRHDVRRQLGHAVGHWAPPPGRNPNRSYQNTEIWIVLAVTS
jgi:hypothetical protein